MLKAECSHTVSCFKELMVSLAKICIQETMSMSSSTLLSRFDLPFACLRYVL